MNRISDIGFFLLASLGSAFVGWGIVFTTSRIERERQRRNIERFGKTDVVPPDGLQQPAEKLLRRL